ncbi:MAG TPA: molybdenum cofactor guanylyltransferase [bacterium]|nr:molybdenum cofactor guanylyltransferase [bacterium]
MSGRILPLTAAVLAGGPSQRFGSPKALASWNDETMIEAVLRTVSAVCSSTIVVGRNLRSLRRLERNGVRLVRDQFRTPHPLGGLFTALDASPTAWVFVAACDTPLLRPALVRVLWSARRNSDAVVARVAGRFQPLGALYNRACLPVIQQAIEAGDYSLQRLLLEVRTNLVSSRELAAADPEGMSFRDADTPRALRQLQEHERSRHPRAKGTPAFS